MSEKFPQITDLPDADAEAYRTRQDHAEKAPEKPLSQSELETSLDGLSQDEVSIVAGARIDTMLLDLEENPGKAGESFADRKGEIEDALKIVNTTKPDEKRGLSVSGVIGERIEKTKDTIEEYPGSTEAKSAERRLAALELAHDVLHEAFWEASSKLAAKTSRLNERHDQKKADELYQEHQDVINSDARHDHNSRVRENAKRRKILEQKKLVAGIKTRS